MMSALKHGTIIQSQFAHIIGESGSGGGFTVERSGGGV
jgi:hypothetical protein